MTQQGFFLNLLERLCRSNLYLFIFSRFLAGRFLTKYIYDVDFKIIKILYKNNYFNNLNNPIIDVGANDGMSYKTIRNFLKKNTIVSFEPINYNFQKLIELKNKDKNFRAYKYALSSKKSSYMKLFIPFFKKYPITQFAGLNKTGVINRLKKSLYVSNLLKKIKINSYKIKTKKIDDYKFCTPFIKIDIEGHEYECILGAKKTIKKYAPAIMVEYDKKICNKIFKVLKQMNYQKYFYDKESNLIRIHKNENVFNVFFISKKKLKYIKV
tara:strand:- start:46 stop:849 length:804 start_codon:yes stop_codon:yes gene_type:complete